jgi:predicted TIM-barrel fold metal-dependent hydrolase
VAGFANVPELLALARYPNVAIKASAAPFYSAETYPYRDIHPYLRQLYESFGAERMFWGTDITRMPCTWRECITMFTEELTWLSDRDKELTMGRALCEWLEWQPG